MKLYRKMFASEIDMQHVKKDYYKVHYSFSLRRRLRSD